MGTGKPNIVYIFPDQHRGDTMGCVGHPVVKTPNMDRLAEEGVVFGQCYTNAPLCMPARASMMTGQHVNKHGVWDNLHKADCKGPSHVRNIRDAGYRTSVFGKMHLYPHQPGVGHTRDHIQEVKDWGFEDIHELPGAGGCTFVGNPFNEYLESKGLLDKYLTHLRPPAANGGIRRMRHPWEVPPCPLPSEDTIDFYTARKSIEWLRNYDGNKPFYLQVLLAGPHGPLDSPAEYRAMYRPEDMPLGIMDKPVPPLSPPVEKHLSFSRLDGMTEFNNQFMRTYYYGKVTVVDDCVGRILKTLEEIGLLDKTWIIYASDHGEMLGDHRLHNKSVFYEGAVHVPCIIRPPGGVNSWKSNGLTDLLDISATLVEIAGAKPLDVSDGRSLMQQIMAGPDSPGAQQGKEAVFSEINGYSMVLDNQYKMAVHTVTRQPVELYDRVNDPDELHNLVNEPSMEEVKRRLLEEQINSLLTDMDEIALKEADEMGVNAIDIELSRMNIILK